MTTHTRTDKLVHVAKWNAFLFQLVRDVKPSNLQLVFNPIL